MFRQLNNKLRLLKVKDKEPYLSIYKITGYYPNNVQLYEQAFLHKSSSVEADDGRWLNNERLEFLGDAILDSIVADVVYKHFPNKREGFLTNTRSKIVQRDTLNRVAVELGLDKMVRFSARMNSHNNHVYGNALEAFIGAVYLDQGYRRCFQFVTERIINRYIDLDVLARKEVNFKSSLIEWSQKNKLEISFDLIENFTDNEGNPVFQTAACLGNRQMGIGIGYSKKESQQNAAKMAVKKLRTDKEFQQYVSDLKNLNSANNETSTSEDVAKELDELPESE
ncbi:ribonuclease-3 [Parabacteroides sp. PFB2-10]|uniref:ribonuclease III n=1 Tax=Parabacteroides sp. PFB2-10 TaxID=1742405 RepID=UPI0024752A85|nr:ribonuclease III [Parabacteroides sp. PFB2-10]MDH6313759.1 ribonuclease-3 [Parabacteroides sp. PFB2-10]MDL2244580.1 ribonuclease III [Parabacteroides sp. OttesenSCG-928-J18]